MITDDYINKLFDGTNFGVHINTSADEKRKQLAKTLQNQVDGYWSGPAAYHIAVNGGFLHDAKKGGEKKLTALGELFMKDHVSPKG